MDLSLLITAVQTVVTSFDFSNLGAIGYAQLLTFLIFGLIGIIVHFAYDVKKGLLEGGFVNLLKYLFLENIAASLKMFTALVTAGATWFAINPIPAPWPTLIFAALTAGYTVDSMFNRPALDSLNK